MAILDPFGLHNLVRQHPTMNHPLRCRLRILRIAIAAIIVAAFLVEYLLTVGKGALIDYFATATVRAIDNRVHRNDGRFPQPVYEPGVFKPEGESYNYTLVVARNSSDDASWIERGLGRASNLEVINYVIDDAKAFHKIPKNKGHEVMAFLTYIIDHYDNKLNDVTIFMHSAATWSRLDLNKAFMINTSITPL
jgi:hypothetical protein